MIDFSTMPPATGVAPEVENEEQKRYRLAHTMPPAVSAQPKAAPDRTVMPPIPSSAAPMRPNASATPLEGRARELALGATAQPTMPPVRTMEQPAAPEIDRNVMPPIPGAGLKVAPGEPSKPASFSSARSDEYERIPGSDSGWRLKRDSSPEAVDRSTMPPIPQSGAEKREQELRAQGRPGSPEGPDLPWWKRALDTVAQIHPIGRLIERNIPGSPGNFDWELARATAAGEQERGATKEKQGIETSASQAQFNTPEKRRAYMAQHPDEFQDVSDFQKNDFILAGKFPQKEPAEAKPDTADKATYDWLVKQGKTPDQALEIVKGAGKPDKPESLAAPDRAVYDSLIKKGMTPQAAYDWLEKHRKVGNANGVDEGGIKDIGDAIIHGEQPPTLQGMYRQGASIRAYLAKQGFNLARAEQDWKATEKHLSTLNGAQQERLRQAVSFTRDSLGIIRDLHEQWKQTGLPGGFKDYNKAALEAATHLPGKAGSVASRLMSQINDLTSELGTVYKGGNSSTDESLKLAAGNLKAEWNDQTFTDSLEQVDKNLGIRENSIRHSRAAGVSENSPYTPKEETEGSGPKAGTVENGYRFKGGNPSDKNNWEKAQ